MYIQQLMAVPSSSDNICMALLCRCVLFFAAANAFAAADLNYLGVSTLWSFEPALTGATVRVAQPEGGDPYWQVNPAYVGQPQGLFTWFSDAGSATTYPNSLGAESFHAGNVGHFLYAPNGGVAPGVAHVDSYEAGYFLNDVIPNQIAIPAKVVNQSFVVGSENPTVDRNYDIYAARYNVLFVSGIGNLGGPQSPATAYNGIAVAALGGTTAVGPSAAGRCKPDITAPAAFTSFSTPQVAGAAAILLQAAARGDGGSGTSADLADIRAIKALLLNGAQKPWGWTNSSNIPLDLRHGAGALNVFQSYRQLRAGRHTAASSQSIALGNPHPPPAPPANPITSRRGWDFATASSTISTDGVRHYFFDVLGPSNRTFTTTLVWNRQQNQTGINDLDLFLYRAPENTLVASSISLLDNVEHLYVTNLPPGQYNLQVFKSGGVLKRVTNNETYALAFDSGPSQPPQFGPPAIAGSQFVTRLSGEPNQRYRIEATTALPGWTSVLTNTTTAAGILDLSFPPGATRCFRAQELP